MMRALWTAGSGMTAQQFNVDVISNNLSNVNTVGYKKSRVEFKDLLYTTLDRAYVLETQGRPVNLQVGHGTAPVATVRSFDNGNLEMTDNPLDVAIDGDGFFTVLGPTGNVVYTRAGNFKIGLTDGGYMLTTSEGYAVLDDAESEIYLDDIDVSTLIISGSGEISYKDETGETVPLGQRLGIVRFANNNGLLNVGGNFFEATDAAGDFMLNDESINPSIVMQRYLEASNVQVVEEMVKLIVAQRAYEINSKAIQSADEMLGIANNLRR
jgi:flagellar basal-body rod protein FlgG